MMPPVIRATDIAKAYGHVMALQGASLELYAGEVVALLGDNGAGKSTMMKTLAGAIKPDSGAIEILGRSVDLESDFNAQSHGIDTVYQDLALAPDLTLAENIFLGREKRMRGLLGRLGVLDRKGMTVVADAAFSQLSAKLPSTDSTVARLSGGQRQAVAIARSVMWAKLAIFMDEPTAALGARQTEIVCDTIRDYAGRGLGILIISHDLPRMLNLAHRFLIMRHGRVVSNLTAAEATMPRILGAMLGEEVAEMDFASRPPRDSLGIEGNQ
jgi:simple sugar transport system ATP-binding protein